MAATGYGETVDRLLEERIAKNDAAFRDANERIGAAAGLYGLESPIPFVCECADPACTEIVTLPLEEYEEIRKDSRRFINVPGHEAAAKGAAVVVTERDGYVIVEKVGHAGEVAESLDERTPAEGLEQTAGHEDR